MIKFSKKGLMYRLALYGNGFCEWNIAENLCPFLRQCLLGLLLCHFYVLVAVLCGTLMLSFCGTLILWGFLVIQRTCFWEQIHLQLHVPYYLLCAYWRCFFGLGNCLVDMKSGNITSCYIMRRPIANWVNKNQALHIVLL